MNKRGEITTTQLIGLIVAILGFAVVLVLLFSLEFENYSEDEICRLSVLTRASTPSSGQNYVPLKCYTGKICITDNDFFGANCPQFAGEKNVNYVRLKGTIEEKARTIEEINANALYDCWNMMGQGKLDLFSGGDSGLAVNLFQEFFSANEIQPTCIICSRVALANDLTNSTDGKKILSLVNVRDYIENTQVPGSSNTYLQTLTDKNVRSFPSSFDKGENLSVGQEVKPVNEVGYIFMQILAEGEPIDKAIKAGANTGVTIAGTLLLSPAGKIVSLVGIKATAILTLLAIGVSGGVAYVQQGDNQDIASYYCGEFTSGAKDSTGKEVSRKGCSIIKPIDYQNINQINSFCKRIEGNP